MYLWQQVKASIVRVIPHDAPFVGAKIAVTFLGFSLLFALLVGGLVQPARAITKEIPFSAQLKFPNGDVAPDGSYNVVFSIYTVDSGGTALWSETQPASVRTGVIAVSLGSVTAFPDSLDFSGSSYYLGIKVGTDAEMSPRIKLGSTVASFSSDNVRGKTPGVEANNILLLDDQGNIDIDGDIITSNSLQSASITTDTLTTTTGNLTIAPAGGTTAITGALTVSTTATIGTTLDVTGATTVGGTLGVTGTTTLTKSGANALALTGAPLGSASSSLLQLGTAISGGNASATGGTYIGVNASPDFDGDFLNFQINNTSKFKIASDGIVTGGSIIPGASGLYDLGRSDFHFANAYIDNLSVASTNTSGTSGTSFTLNSEVASGASAATKNSSLLFYRGGVSTSGQLAWLEGSGTNGIATGSGAFTLNNPAWVLTTLPADADYGQLSIGAAANAFDGSTSGHFAGSSSGTTLAINAATGFGGNLADLQVAGTSKLSVSAAGALTTASTINGQTISSSANFTGTFGVSGITTLSATGGNALAVTGTPLASATSSLVQLGSAIASGDATANGGTYIGLNAGSSFVGNLADLQVNGASRLKVSYAGVLTLSNGSTSVGLSPAGGAGILSLLTTSTQSKLRVYDSAASKYIEATHDGTNSIITSSSGELQLQGSGTNQFIIGDVGTAVNLVFEESSTISGQGGNTITLGTSGDIFNGLASSTGANYLFSTILTTSGLTVSGNSLPAGYTASTTATQLTINGPSSLSGNLLDLQVAGTSKLSVSAGGALTAVGLTSTANTSLTPTVTTGTGSSAGLYINASALTTGNGMDIQGNAVSSGNIVAISSTSTAATSNTQTGLNIALSGTNGTTTQTTYGAQISNTHAGTLSTNYGLSVTASGGTTANYGVNVGAVTVTGVTTNAQLNLGALSGTANGSSNYGINIGNISSAGTTTTNTGVNLGTLTGGTTANYQINTGNLTGIAGATNAQLNLGTVATAGATNYGLFVGNVAGATNNYGIWYNGNPASGATSSVIQVGAALSSGNSSGTVLGANPASFSGDFINLQLANAARFKVDNSGNLTASGTGTHTISGTLQVATITASGALGINSGSATDITITPGTTGKIYLKTSGNASAAVTIGDGATATNYTKFDTNGALTFAGAARPYSEMFLLPVDAVVTGASQCALSSATAGTDGTNPIYYKTLDCDTTAKDAFWQFKMPQNYANASNVQIDVYWKSDATSGAGTFDAGYVSVASGSSWDGAAISNTAGSVVTTNGAGKINTSTITLSAPTINADEFVTLRTRLSASTLASGSTNKGQILKVRVKFLVGS